MARKQPSAPHTATGTLDAIPRQNKLGTDVLEKLKAHLPHLEPGVALQEISLSKQLGVSRTPIREALIRLAAEGLIVTQAGGRYCVPGMSRQDVEELFEIRIALESAGARTLSQKITSRQIAELRTLAETADQAQSIHTDRESWDEAEQAFHGRFLEMVGNSRMIEILNRQGILERCLRLPMDDWQTLASTDPSPPHLKLVEMLKTKDADLAAKGFREHILARQQWILSHLTQA